jgi:hypothetical protein
VTDSLLEADKSLQAGAHIASVRHAWACA